MDEEYDADEPAVAQITMPNAMEEAAHRYWRASRIWRSHDESDWTMGQMIDELRDLQRYRGRIPFLSFNLLEDVVHDRRQPILELQHFQAVNEDAQTSNT